MKTLEAPRPEWTEVPAADSRPVLPPPAAAGSSEETARRLRDLRHFHLGVAAAAEAIAAGQYSPAVLHARGFPETPNDQQNNALDDVTVPESEGEQALLHLLLDAATSRKSLREAFREEALVLAGQGKALLDAGRGDPEGQDPTDELALGAAGTRFIEPSSLARMLDRRGAGAELTPPRRESLGRVLATLGHLADGRELELLVVHRGDETGAVVPEQPPEGWRTVEHDDPCSAAAEIFDQEAEKLARGLSAVARLRLESSGEYRPELHDPWLEQLDWQAFSRDELLLLPPIVAVVSADRVAGLDMASLSRLLLSGRPVQVFVLTPPAADPGAGDAPLQSFRFEPGTFGISHRQALVQQTSTARPDHMLQGFSRALASTRTGLHVIASAGASGALEPERAAAALAGRAHSLFRFDPEAGPAWAQRLDLADNPQPQADWPVYDLEVRRHDGTEETLPLAFTFADFALLEPSYAGHFTPVPEDVAAGHLVDMASYCARPASEEVSEIPFIWGLDGDSWLCRLAVSRPLALACRDRLSTWRNLRQLAGVGHAVPEAENSAAREVAEEPASQRMPTAAEIERIRHDAATEVVDRLITALFDVDPGGDVAAVASRLPATPTPGAAAADRTEADGAEADGAREENDESAGFEPCIDTELCTTCNECTNLNPRMFAYNADKKAYIKDPRAGTFQQLVQAAELCTARIIHPGTPLDPDEKDLEPWIKRAEPFN